MVSIRVELHCDAALPLGDPGFKSDLGPFWEDFACSLQPSEFLPHSKDTCSQHSRGNITETKRRHTKINPKDCFFFQVLSWAQVLPKLKS